MQNTSPPNILVTNVNTSLALRRPTVLPQSQEIQSSIRRRTLTRAAARRPQQRERKQS